MLYLLYELLKHFLGLCLVPQRNLYSVLSTSSYVNPNCTYLISNEMREFCGIFDALKVLKMRGVFVVVVFGFLFVVVLVFAMSKLLLQYEAKSLNPVMTPLTGVTFAVVRESLPLSHFFSPSVLILCDQCKFSMQRKICNFMQAQHDPGNTCIGLSALSSKFNPIKILVI